MAREPSPDTEQVTTWRNVLDALAQLSSSWQVAKEAHNQSHVAEALHESTLPESVVVSFARGGEEAAEALAGLAAILAEQAPDGERFAEIVGAQREAHEQWAAAHRSVRGDAQS